MTATARQIITRALRRIRVIAAGETPEADMATDALEVMNDMMAGWNADAILYAHAELGLDDTVNVPDEQLAFVRDLLCEQLAEEYGQTLGPLMLRSIQNARGTMQAAYFIPRTTPVDAAIGSRDVMIGPFGPYGALLVNDDDFLTTE